MKTNPIKVGDVVEVIDLRDGTILTNARVESLREDDAPVVGKRLVASLSVGYTVAVKCLKKISKTRTATQKESLYFVNEMHPRDAEQVKLKDGNQKAVRVIIDNLTGKPQRNPDGRVVICAPWLLSDIFFV